MVRTIQIAILTLLGFLLTSCQPVSDNNLPDNINIKDLAPINPDGSPEFNKLKTLNLDLHILEVPVENFSKLDEIRRTLRIRPLKFNNYLAFSENSFSAYYGKNLTLSTVYGLLQIAGAQNVIRTAVMLPDGESDDVIIKQLPQIQTVSYSSLKGSQESARIGPGYFAMHIGVVKSNALKDAATVTIFPIFTIMSSNAISQLNQIEKERDFPFTSAALRLDMTPGDFIFLAPERLIIDQSTLCGLFFGNPFGSIFLDFNDRKPPERKPTVRVYVLTCVGLNF